MKYELLASLHGRMVAPRRTQMIANRIAALLPPNARVLDFGAGDGTIASLCMAQRRDCSIEGIDVLVRKDTRVPVTRFDGKTIPFHDGAFDAVIAVDVLHHTDDIAATLSEAARVARDALIVKDHFAENTVDHGILRAMDWVGNAPHGVVLPYNYLSRREWEQCFANAGLRVDEMTSDIGLYPFPFCLLFERGLHFIARLHHAAKA
jgi:SAM-dependent methyltransferase